MGSSLSLFYTGGREGTTGFLLPYQRRRRQRRRAAWAYFPARPILVPPLCNSIANPALSMYQSLANLNLQSNQPGTALLTAFLSSELAGAPEQMVQLEACLVKAEEVWQWIAKEHGEAMAASLQQRLERSIGSSPDAGDAEPREGIGMELCEDGE